MRIERMVTVPETNTGAVETETYRDQTHRGEFEQKTRVVSAITGDDGH